MSRMDRTRRIRDALHMAWKRALSYRKREWEFEDYPIRVRVQKDVPDDSRYWVRILGWNMDGLGRTQADALADVRKWYDTRKATLQNLGKPVPRPGTDVPIEFASQARVTEDQALMDDFIDRVLKLPWAFLSDQSSLMHFTSDGNVDMLVARIRDVYGVDVSNVTSGNIAEILERIAAERVR